MKRKKKIGWKEVVRREGCFLKHGAFKGCAKKPKTAVIFYGYSTISK